MMVVYWIGVFACAFWYLDINNLINNNGQIQHHSIIGWSSHSLMSFFSMQQGTFNIEAIWSNGAYWLLLDMEILFAYLHLGILIAYLYQKVSRK
jgi:hypothetical protein